MPVDAEKLVGKLTEDETVEVLDQCFVALPNHVSIETITKWAKDNALIDELIVALDIAAAT